MGLQETLISNVVSKVADWVSDEIAFQWGIEDEITLIKRQLDIMKASLSGVKRIKDNDLQEECIKLGEEIALTMEDTIEEYQLDMELNELKKSATTCSDISFCFTLASCYFEQTLLRFKLHQNLKSINKLVDLLEKKGNFESGRSEEETGGGYLNYTPPFVEDLNVVGIEEDLKELKNVMDNYSKSKEHMVVITVSGKAGSGKTTLTNKLYNVKKKSFDCYAWVFVSQNLEVASLLRKMVNEFFGSRGDQIPSKLEAKKTDVLERILFNYLKNKRYALFIDSLWEPNLLQGIKNALPPSAGSSIIITTQDETIVSGTLPLLSHLPLKTYHREVHPLDAELAWDLFCSLAFRCSRPQGKCPRNLEKKGKEIVGWCGGCPLAVIVVAQMMSGKGHDPRKWNEVQSLSPSPYHPNLSRLNKVLLLSYAHLPPNLRCCFLYCAMFPRGTRIKCNKLVRLWIAEGFVRGDPCDTPEKVGKDYILQLVNRKMLQPVTSSDEDFVACQIPDLMHGLAIQMIDEDKFGMIFTGQGGTLPKCRRLIIHEDGDSADVDMRNIKLRSLFVHGAGRLCWSLHRMLQGIRFLRVLDLNGLWLTSLHEELGNLILLKYLGLRKTTISNLPGTLKRLIQLQTLDIRNTTLGCLPACVAELHQLRHLLVKGFREHRDSVKMPRVTFKLSQLQTLSGVNVDMNLVGQLEHMTQMRKLHIYVGQDIDWEKLCIAIAKMGDLQSLKIESPKELELETLSPPLYLEKLALGGTIKNLPTWVTSHDCLRTIELGRSKLMEDPFITLGRLPNLASLKLFEAYDGKQIACEPKSFLNLKTLHIGLMHNLEIWKPIEEGTMNELQFLGIHDCPNLCMLPDGMQNLASLKKLCLHQMPKRFLRGLSREGEDHWKIKHITNISLVHLA